MAQFAERLGIILLPEKKVAVPPCHVRRDRMSRLGLLECFSSARRLANGFIRIRQIHPVRVGSGIRLCSPLVVQDGSAKIALLEVPLLVEAQAVPILGIGRLQISRTHQAVRIPKRLPVCGQPDLAC